MITSRKTNGGISRVLSQSIKEWFSFSVLWLLEYMDVNPVLGFVALVRLREDDRSASEEQKWFPYEYKDVMIIFFKCAAPLKRVFWDTTK